MQRTVAKAIRLEADKGSKEYSATAQRASSMIPDDSTLRGSSAGPDGDPSDSSSEDSSSSSDDSSSLSSSESTMSDGDSSSSIYNGEPVDYRSSRRSENTRGNGR